MLWNLRVLDEELQVVCDGALSNIGHVLHCSHELDE